MRATIAIVLSFLCLSSWAQPAHLLNGSYAARSIYLDSLNEVLGDPGDAASAGKLLALQLWAGQQGDRDFALQVNLRRLRRSNFGSVSHTEDSLKDVVVAAMRNGSEMLQADALQELGNFYWQENRRPSSGLESHVEAYNIYSKFPVAAFPYRQAYTYELGGSYFRYEDYDHAILYLREALALAPGSSLAYTTVNTLGLSYLRAGKPDTALGYFKGIYDKAVANHDSSWTGIAAGNIGNCYFIQKKYREAIPMLETDVNYSLLTSQMKSAAGSLYKLSVIYYLQGDVEKSQQLVEKALGICEVRSFWPIYTMADQFFTQLSKVYAARNDIKRAYLYADSALTAKDSVAAERTKLDIARSQEKIDFIRHKLETGKLASEKRIQELVRNTLVALIFMMCIIGVLFINRQRLKQKKLIAEKKNAESELDIAALQLANITQSVQEKNQLIEHITAEFERIKAGEETKTDEELLTQLERATILTDEQWDNFRDVFEKVHKGFFASLKKKIPDLTPAEIRFLALTKLKLTSKEMASMLAISTNAIKIYRHRLRRKLDLDKEDMIEELVASV